MDVKNGWLSARDAARQLRVNEARVRALLEKGEIPGRKLSDRWLIPAQALDLPAIKERVSGRPLSQRNAWGLLFLASGLPAPWLSAIQRSRLRARLRAPRFPLGARFRRRAHLNYLRGDNRAIRHISDDNQFVRSGVSAGEAHDADIATRGVVEGYLPRERLDELSYLHALRPVPEAAANLIVRSIDGFWPFRSEHVAPAAVVAIDLIDSSDQRSRRAGSQLLERVRRRLRTT